MDSETVLGHYVADATGQWVPALQQSTELFKAIVNDDINPFEAEFDALGDGSLGAFTILYWSEGKGGEQATPQVQAKSRSLLALSVHHGSLRVLSYLLSKGANPRAGQDGQNAYEFIQDSNPNAPTIRAMLDDAAGNFALMGGDSASSAQRTATPEEQSSAAQTRANVVQQDADQSDFDSLPYSTADLTRAEYATDTFRMYCFKVLLCSKRYAHDWRACPFAHPTENARRRDPREFCYSSLVCPDYRQGCCVRGDTCQYAHGVFESWLHPSRYRTQLCKDQEKCDRPVCFFAHNIKELRTPVDSFVPHPEERLRVPEAMQVVLGMAPQGSLSGGGASSLSLSGGGADTAFSADQNSIQIPNPNPACISEQLLSPSQRSSSGGALAASSSGAGSAAAGSSSGGGGPEAGSFGLDQGSGSSSGVGGRVGSSPTKQLVTPNAMPVPRMSNAFARKHGLDPKENPLVNLQRLAFQQQIPQQQAAAAAAAAAGGRRPRRGRGQNLNPQALLPQMPLQGPPMPYMQQPLSPAAAAAAYYGGPGSLGPLQPGPQVPTTLMPDPQAVALLFGGMNLAGGPISPAAAAAMAGQQMHQQMAASMGYQSGYHHHMSSPVGHVAPHVTIPQGMLVGEGLGPAGLGPPSPLQPGMTPTGAAGLPSPQPQPF